MKLLALLVLTAATSVAQVPENEGVCIWADGEHRAVLDDLKNPYGGGYGGIGERALRRHHRGHRWAAPTSGKPTLRAECVPDALERLARAAEEDTSCLRNGLVIAKVAYALECNGMAERGIKLLTRVHESLPEEPAGGPGAWRNLRRSVEEQLGLMWFRAGDYEHALAYLNRYRPSGGCGLAVSEDIRQNDRRRARCMVELDLWDDLVALCLKQMQRSFSWRTMCFTEDLIELARRRGEADPVRAVRTALGELGASQEAAFKQAVLHEEILRGPIERRRQGVLELLGNGEWHDEVVAELVASAPEGVLTWEWIFRAPLADRTPSQEHLAFVLAQSGDPRLETVLREDAEARGGVDTFSPLDVWTMYRELLGL
jgi:hypothetical protein